MAPVNPANAHATLSAWLLADGLPIVCDLDKSQGAYLHDAKTGRDYLDFSSFSGTRPLGFNHPKLNDPTLVDRLGRVALHKPSAELYTLDHVRFVHTFATVALGGEFRHVFFVDGGGPAVDSALKAAIDWRHRKNATAGRGEKGAQIISFKQGFHGHTGYALSVTDSVDRRKSQYYPRFEWPRVQNPKMRFPFDSAALQETILLEKQALDEIDAVFARRRDEVAAIVIEPIQGEGGDNYFRTEFLRTLRKICDDRECLLVFDELQTGFGATGKWWDWQTHGVRPDLMVFGRRAQPSGFAATERLDEVDSVFNVPARLSGTFAGNVVDMMRTERVIQVIVEDHLLDNATTMGGYLLKLLREQAAMRSELSNVRGRGLWAAFDLGTADKRDRLVKACFEEELLVLPGGQRTVRLRPALDIGADAIGRAAAQLEAALKRAFGRKP